MNAFSCCRNCLFDMCVEPNNNEMLCRDVEQYVLVCQERGIAVQNWRERTSCGEHEGALSFQTHKSGFAARRAKDPHPVLPSGPALCSLFIVAHYSLSNS